MTTDDHAAQAREIGRQRAEAVLQQRRIAHEKRAAALAGNAKTLRLTRSASRGAESLQAHTTQTAGFLLALGDSWFDYPVHDVLTKLDDEHGYNVESAAHAGDPIENMAYQGGQIDRFARCFEKVMSHGAMPKAILLSGGGDDIAGREFGMLLNSVVSPIHGWNADVVEGVIDVRIRTGYTAILTAVNTVSQSYSGRMFPVLVHGYDYPVPDGRGFLWGWPFPGPWLQPGLREKGFDDLDTGIALLRLLIDRFNQMMTDFAAASAGQVHYIDLRNTLSTVVAGDAYKAWWANELHPTGDGFSVIAARFAAVLTQV